MSAVPQPRLELQLVLLLLVLSVPSARHIPFVQPWGYDLFNLWLFQRCEAVTDSAYALTGAECGDPGGRRLLYPPLLYHSFAWLRLVTQATAVRVWAGFQLVALLGCLLVWVRYVVQNTNAKVRLDWPLVTFGLLLGLQYPTLFALERGQSDIGALLFYTAAAVAFVRQQYAIAGVFAGLAMAYKLYPLFASVVLTGGLFAGWLASGRPRTKLGFLKFGAAACVAFVAVQLAFFRDSKLFFFEVLPAFSSIILAAMPNNHSLQSLIPGFPGVGWLLGFGLLGAWAVATWRCVQRAEPALALAGALAVSTYFQGTSWDYNLITTFPLLILLFLRARTSDRWAVLALGVVALLVDRHLFADPGLFLVPSVHIALQAAFLLLAALEAAHPADAEPGTASFPVRLEAKPGP